MNRRGSLMPTEPRPQHRTPWTNWQTNVSACFRATGQSVLIVSRGRKKGEPWGSPVYIRNFLLA